MSKRNKKKYNSQYSPTQPSSSADAASQQETKANSVYAAHREEYRYITADLIRVGIINGLFLAGVIALYYANRTNHFLDSWYSKIF